MDERKIVVIVLLITLVVSLLSFKVLLSLLDHGNLIELGIIIDISEEAQITRYEAIIDNYTLHEHYVYKVNDKDITMLYRNFTTPLVVDQKLPGTIVVLNISCPSDAYWYVVDRNINIYSNVPDRYHEILEQKIISAEARNEAGCFNPNGFQEGAEYNVSFTFLLVPDHVYHDGEYVGYRFVLAEANKHLDYKNISIESKNNTLILLLSPLSNSSEVVNRLELSVLPRSYGLEIAVIGKTSPPAGAEIEHVDNVVNALGDIAKKKQLIKNILYFISINPIILALLAPGIILGVYNIAGKEHEPTGKIPYGMPPRTGEKPWEVAALYSSKAGSLSSNLIASVLVDLHLRGLLIIDPNTNKVQYVEHDELDRLESLIVKALEVGRREASTFLRTAANVVRERAAAGIKRNYIKIFLSIIIISIVTTIISGVMFSKILNILPIKIIISSFILPISAYIPPLLAPPYIFGKWKPGYREKAIAWHKFKKEVRSLPSSIVEESPEIAPYAVALLGVRKTKHILMSLGISIALVKTIETLAKRLYRTHRSRSSRGSGGGSGGFGGGGAGAR